MTEPEGAVKNTEPHTEPHPEPEPVSEEKTVYVKSEFIFSIKPSTSPIKII